MKIVCICQKEEKTDILIKPETAMLVNGKPLFIPDFTDDLRVSLCMLLHINRLGRNIAERFASRYFDEMTLGLDFAAYDKLQKAKQEYLSISPFVAFDGSMAIGQWQGTDFNFTDYDLTINQMQISNEFRLVCTPEQAIAEASRYFKLCTGDIIAIRTTLQPIKLNINDHIDIVGNDNTILTMNIK